MSSVHQAESVFGVALILIINKIISSGIIANHEVWHTCTNCNKVYDMRSDGFYCPHCGHNNK